MPRRLLPFVFALTLLFPAAHAGEAGGFLRDGERWLLLGDSITHNDTYRRLLLRLIAHHHPEADIVLGNGALSGVRSNYKEDAGELKPTLVTIMLGMNDVIHAGWSYAPDYKQRLEKYRAAMLERVRKYKEMGADVVLMSPTLTDEGASMDFFEVQNTAEILRAFGRAVHEIAQQEEVFYLPVAEDLEHYQRRLDAYEVLRQDGVHPSALGQYCIARTFYERFGIGRPLGGPRTLREPTAPATVAVSLRTRFLEKAADGIDLDLTAKEARTVTASWSLGDDRGTVELELQKGTRTWSVPVKAASLPAKPGACRWLILELAERANRSLYVLDLARVPVLHLQDGTVSGTITADDERAEGKTVGTWTIERRGKALLFSGEVTDAANKGTGLFPWMRDGVGLWLDLRPPERYGGPGLDADVFQTVLTVRKEPKFCLTPVPWVGRALQYAASAGGEATETGYRWHLILEGAFSTARRFDAEKMDCFGFNLVVTDADGKTTRHYPAFKADQPPDVHAGTLMLVDLNRRFQQEAATNLHLWGW